MPANASRKRAADVLLDFLIGFQDDALVVNALLDARSDLSARRDAFRQTTLRYVQTILCTHTPRLPETTAWSMSQTLLHNMKRMATLSVSTAEEADPELQAELRDMTRAYLERKLAP